MTSREQFLVDFMVQTFPKVKGGKAIRIQPYKDKPWIYEFGYSFRDGMVITAPISIKEAFQNKPNSLLSASDRFDAELDSFVDELRKKLKANNKPVPPR